MIGSWLQLRAGTLLQAWRTALLAALPQALLGALRPERWEIQCTEPPTVRRPSRPSEALPLTALSRRDQRRAVLAAPAASVLRRRLVLPRAALLELDAVVRLDVPVSTPFSLDEVHVAAAPAGRLGRDRVDVAMALVPRETIRPWLERLASHGLQPRWLRLGPKLLVDLDPARAAREHAALRLDGLLAILALVLAGGAFLLASAHQDARLVTRRQALSESLAEIDRSAALERRIAVLSQRIAFLPARRLEALSPIRPLTAVAAALPRELRLSAMTVQGMDVSLRIAAHGAQADGPRRFAETAFAPGYVLTEAAGAEAVEIKGQLRQAAPEQPPAPDTGAVP